MASKILYNEVSSSYIFDWAASPDRFSLVVTPASGKSIELTSIKLMLANHRQPGGSFTINVYDVDGSNNPTGSILATASVLGSNVTPVYDVNVFGWYVAETLYEFTFDSSVTIGPGDSRAIIFDQPFVPGIFTTLKAIAFALKVPGTVIGSDFDTTFIRRYTSGAWSDWSSYVPHFQLYGNVSSAPTKAKTPTPDDAANDTSRALQTITWEDGGGADTYNVYYGTESGNLTLVSSAQAGLSFTVHGIADGGPYPYAVTRYWRIDSTNAAGTTTGDEWSFTTLPEGYQPPWPDDRPPGYDPDDPAGGGRYKTRVLALGHKVVYFGDL